MNKAYMALRHRDFRCYIGVRFFFTLAYQMQITVIGLYRYEQFSAGSVCVVAN